MSLIPGFKGLLVYSLVASAAYALIEVRVAPWRWLDFKGLHVAGLGTYHLLFMLPLFILVSALPSRRGLASAVAADRLRALVVTSGTFFLLLVAEDIFYFLFAGGSIEPGIFTTQWGYLSLAGQVIPLWYLWSAAASAAAFYLTYGTRTITGLAMSRLLHQP